MHQSTAPDPFTPVSPSRRRFLAGLAGTAGLALLAACGTGDDTTAPAGSAGQSGSTGPATDQAQPRSGGRLRAVVGGASAASDSLDPHVIGTSAGGALSKNVWDKLVAYDNDLTLRYRLAQSLEPNADGTQWRITLRDGVVFSDGTPLTSQDVLYSFRRMLAEDKPSAGDLAVVDLDRTVADGDLAVVVAMREPLADFGSVLAGWYCYIVQDGSDVFDAQTLPPGTGPFVVTSWSPGDRALLTRNDRYWDSAPLLDEVEIIQVADTEARMNAFSSGEADLVHDISFLQAQTAAAQEDITLLVPPAGIMGAFQMRTDMAPFDDVRVRQALRLVVDRQAMVDTVYYGYAEIGNDLYGKGAPNYAAGLPQRTRDPEQARALLREAGLEDLTVTLTTANAEPGMIEMATLFAQQAEAAGITVQLETVPADTYFSQVAGKAAFTHTGWWNYSLEYYFGQTLTSDAPSNGTAWRRPEWDATFARARATLDPQERERLYFELQEELWHEGGILLHSFAKKPTAVRSFVRGVPEGVPGTDDWGNYRTAWLDR
ncbi:ABC transporter substrate-binding protein [Nakamurella leprariae]|uniref:ABC transporter substrate-binding protein n=1 Tax=Nakamurella leprariae TaxID=2803911 RepID=A0A938YEL8_9ACTN|nr:ABC transporter substrate-binding protein [Nakamurella leprariae]MBM9469292.1 ABC transporter substrate-binding protein [Nakamurella leprariae]